MKLIKKKLELKELEVNLKKENKEDKERKKLEKSVAKLIIMSATLDSREFAKYFSINLQSGLFFIPAIRSKG